MHRSIRNDSNMLLILLYQLIYLGFRYFLHEIQNQNQNLKSYLLIKKISRTKKN